MYLTINFVYKNGTKLESHTTKIKIDKHIKENEFTRKMADFI